MKAAREASFNSSVVTTLPAWRTFVERSPEPTALLSDEELGRLTPAERLAYDDERGDYHAELPATKGLLFMRLNRGQQTGTPCGMIVSGVPGVGKTTAVKALGRTVEQTYRKRNPQMTWSDCWSWLARDRSISWTSSTMTRLVFRSVISWHAWWVSAVSLDLVA